MTTFDEAAVRRQPAGVTGAGQFATRPRSEAAVALVGERRDDWKVSPEDPDVEWLLSGTDVNATLVATAVERHSSGDYDLPHVATRYDWDVTDDKTGDVLARGFSTDKGAARRECAQRLSDVLAADAQAGALSLAGLRTAQRGRLNALAREVAAELDRERRSAGDLGEREPAERDVVEDEIAGGTQLDFLRAHGYDDERISALLER